MAKHTEPTGPVKLDYDGETGELWLQEEQDGEWFAVRYYGYLWNVIQCDVPEELHGEYEALCDAERAAAKGGYPWA